MKNVLRKNYPIHAVLKNGTNIILNGRFEVAAIAAGYKNYTIDGELLVIKNELGTIKLKNGTQNGDPLGVFFEEQYKMLPIKNHTVLDIGANMADSSIYFVLRGAKKVVALEPLPANYDMATKNIELNNFKEVIKIILGACSSKSGFFKVDEKKIGGSQQLDNSRGEKEIPLISLTELFEQNNLDDPVVKIDCEGCEYDIILNTSDEILKKFHSILIEYHYGYQNIVEKLENCGFKVKTSRPMYYSNYYLGYILATKN
jgi:FkbM family methyltransferase